MLPVGREHREPVERVVERDLLQPGTVDIDQEDVEVALLRVVHVGREDQPLAVGVPRRRKARGADVRHLPHVAAVPVHHVQLELRRPPHVILIGELRDEESAQAALQAAESGHFVLSTMHTIDAAETIGRLVEFFPAGKQQMTRQILAGVLRGVVSQRLLPKKGGGRVAAVEVMVNTARIADLIRDGETDKITEAIEDGDFHKMQSFSQHLVQLVLADLVEEGIAASAASNRHDFEMAVQQALKRRRADEKAAEAEAQAEAAG